MQIRLAGGLGYQELLTFDESNLTDLFGLSAEFVVTRHASTLPPSCGDCASGAGGSSPLMLGVLGVFALGRRSRARGRYQSGEITPRKRPSQ